MLCLAFHHLPFLRHQAAEVALEPVFDLVWAGIFCVISASITLFSTQPTTRDDQLLSLVAVRLWKAWKIEKLIVLRMYHALEL